MPWWRAVQDFNGDGEFDNYFHLKALTINGVYAGNPASYVVLNGSSNWSGYAAVCDENFAILTRRSPTMKYQRFIDFWYENFPTSKPHNESVARMVARGHIDPYAHVDMDRSSRDRRAGQPQLMPLGAARLNVAGFGEY